MRSTMVSRNSSSRVNGSLSAVRSWESFCREEAREAASTFLDRVRRYKSRNVGARDVHDSTFTNEFSAAFLEESSVLMASSGYHTESRSQYSNSNGYTSVLVRSMPPPAQLTHEDSATSIKSTGSSRTSNRTSKAWWSNLFKWPKARRERRPGSTNSSSSSNTARGVSPHRKVILREGNVQLLDFTDALNWSQCKLVLSEVQGNHQVEVFSPPKSSNPKMSLFCFLIEDVRSTTSLEMPDSSSCFVIKTQNHGEYVFDAGKEHLKQQWVDAVSNYSIRRFQSNGHVPRPNTTAAAAVPNGRLRSASIGESLSNYVIHATLPRAPPTTRQPPQQGEATSEVNSNCSPPHVVSSGVNLGMGQSDSEESIMVDVSSFLRNHPYRSPNRQQRTQSMFVNSYTNMQSHPLHTQLSPLHPSPPSQQASPTRFPYSSPTSTPPRSNTPPPLPKRDIIRQRSQSVSNHASSNINHTPPSPSIPPMTSKSTNDRSNPTPKRKFSQPFLEVPSTTTIAELSTNNECELPTPGNLETCSQSSSTSALHPVSLAAMQRSVVRGRRGSSSSNPPTDTPQQGASLLNYHHKSPKRGHMRKISAPVIAPQDVAKLELENGMRCKMNAMKRPKYGSDNVLNSNAGLSNTSNRGVWTLDGSPREVEQVLESDRELEEGASGLLDDPTDYSSIPSHQRFPSVSSNDESTSHRSTMSFPINHRQSSPPMAQQRPLPPPPSAVHRSNRNASESVGDGGESSHQLDVLLSEVGRIDLNHTLQDSGRNSPHSQLSGSVGAGGGSVPNRDRDGAHSRTSNHTNSSTRNNSSSDETDSSSTGVGVAPLTSSTNPIFIEANGSQDQPIVMHTQHPYEFWATREQDVVNLRVLSNYPWFHGMISRTNASQLVLAGGDSGTGQYLVRQSESREGDFVLTFNYHDRAKHLRMTLDEGGCNIQHLWFDDVPNMLEYFKTNSIPLESFWLNDDVKLTTYIDRQASDSFRTTTVIHTDRLNRVPPRRSRSLHIGMSRSIASNNTNSPSSSTPNTPIPNEGELSSVSSSNSHSTNSLPHSTRHSTGWRQLFRSQRSSSAGNVGRVQRRHSTNAGSMLSTTTRSGTGSRSGGGGSGGGRSSSNENTYILRHY